MPAIRCAFKGHVTNRRRSSGRPGQRPGRTAPVQARVASDHWKAARRIAQYREN